MCVCFKPTLCEPTTLAVKKNKTGRQEVTAVSKENLSHQRCQGCGRPVWLPEISTEIRRVGVRAGRDGVQCWAPQKCLEEYGLGIQQAPQGYPDNEGGKEPEDKSTNLWRNYYICELMGKERLPWNLSSVCDMATSVYVLVVVLFCF
jgi:hypothetical protein